MIEINDLQEDYLLTELSFEQTTAISGGGFFGALIGAVAGGIYGAFSANFSVAEGAALGASIGALAPF